MSSLSDSPAVRGLRQSLIAYYPLKSDFKDYGPRGYHASPTPAARFVPGYLGNAADFSAPGAYATLPSMGRYADAYTVSAFVRVWADGGGLPSEWDVLVGSLMVNRKDGQLSFLFHFNSPTGGSPQERLVISTGRLRDGEWQHVIVTYDHSVRTLNFYLDGGLASSHDLSGFVPTEARPRIPTEWSIGGQLVGGHAETPPLRWQCGDLFFFNAPVDQEQADILAGLEAVEPSRKKFLGFAFGATVVIVVVAIVGIGVEQYLVSQTKDQGGGGGFAGPGQVITSECDTQVLQPIATGGPSRWRYEFEIGDEVISFVVKFYSSLDAKCRYALVSPDETAYPDSANADLYLETIQGGRNDGGLLQLVANAGMAGLLVPVAENRPIPPGRWSLRMFYEAENNPPRPEAWLLVRRLQTPAGRPVVRRVSRLLIQPILALVRGQNDKPLEDLRAALIGIQERIRAQYAGAGLHIIWRNLAVTDPLDAPLSDSMSDQSFKDVVTRYGGPAPSTCNMVFTWRIAAEGNQAIRGKSAGVPGVPRQDGMYNGILISMTAIGIGGMLTEQTIALTAAHELGHWLGLTHQSSKEIPGNLMRTAPSDYGPDLNDVQRFIIKQHPQVHVVIIYH